MFLDDFSAQIGKGRVGRDFYNEYDCDSYSNMVTSYICCEEGTEYSISWEDERRPHQRADDEGIKAIIYVDGQFCGSRYLMNQAPCRFWGVSAGPGCRQPLMFAHVSSSVTTDVMQSTNDAAHLKALGSIELQIFRGRVRPRRSQHGRQPYDVAARRNGREQSIQIKQHHRILEEAKPEGVSHSTRFGDPVDMPPPRNPGGGSDLEVTDFERDPYVRFRWYYRSQTALEAKGILIHDEDKRHNSPTALHLVSPSPFLKRSQASTVGATPTPSNGQTEVIEIKSDSEDEDAMFVDNDRDWRRGRSVTRFSTEPPESHEELQRQRDALRRKLEL